MGSPQRPKVLWSGENENGKRSRLYEGGVLSIAWDNPASTNKALMGLAFAHTNLLGEVAAVREQLGGQGTLVEQVEAVTDAAELARLERDEARDERNAFRVRVAMLEREANDKNEAWGHYSDEARQVAVDARDALRARADAAEARVATLEAAIRAKAADFRSSHGEDEEGPHPIVAWAERVLRGASQPPTAPAQVSEEAALAARLRDLKAGEPPIAFTFTREQPPTPPALVEHPPEEDDGEVPEVLVMPEPTRLRGTVPLADGTAAWDVQRRETSNGSES